MIDPLGYEISRALIIAEPHIGRILSGDKRWEMRSTKTSITGRIGLIRKGSGLIVGSVDLLGWGTPLNEEDAANSVGLHRVFDLSLLKKWKYPWIMENQMIFPTPIPYNHPKGAVIWVKL